MKRLGYCIALVAMCSVLCYGIANNLFLMADLRRGDSGVSTSWYPVVNITSNSYHLWRDPPLLTTITNVLPQQRIDVRASRAFEPLLVVFFIGVSLLLRERSMAERLALAAAATTLLALGFGRDTVVFGALSFLPWLALSYQTATSLWSLAGTVVISILFALGANQFALLLLPVAWFAADIRSRSSLNATVSVLIVLLIFLFIPLPSLPQYPDLARIVPDDGIPGMVRPLVTADPGIALIDRGQLKAALRPLLLSSLTITLLVLVSLPGKAMRRSLLPPALLLLLVSLDLLLPESLAHIAPLATLERLLPGLFGITLGPVLLAASSLLIAVRAARADRGGLLLALAVGTVMVWWGSSARWGVATPARAATIAAGVDPVYDSVLVSPSLRVVAEYGSWIIGAKKAIEARSQQSLRDFSATIHGSDNEPLTARMFDDRPRSRWSPKKGKQEGNEWFELLFAGPTMTSGIEISPGEFSTDFPRGLTIRGSEQADCSAGTLLFSTASWQGALAFTESGHPYFLSQDKVRVMFPKAVSVRCLRIEQTGRASFDWSVTDVFLFH